MGVHLDLRGIDLDVMGFTWELGYDRFVKINHVVLYYGWIWWYDVGQPTNDNQYWYTVMNYISSPMGSQWKLSNYGENIIELPIPSWKYVVIFSGVTIDMRVYNIYTHNYIYTPRNINIINHTHHHLFPFYISMFYLLNQLQPPFSQPKYHNLSGETIKSAENSQNLPPQGASDLKSTWFSFSSRRSKRCAAALAAAVALALSLTKPST